MNGADLIALVRDTLISHAPPGAPPCVEEVCDARVSGRAPHRRVVGYVRMFDGKPGEVALDEWTYGWSQQWTYLPGGPFMLNQENQWQRYPGPSESQDAA